ncbi:MAG: hypothetical protein JW830_08835 [Bacteroidales bacterium]|nr:hypothetical protein [Bacteroidales bacterium]
MKKRTGVMVALLPFVFALSAYLVFYERIESKPNHVGFWFILVLGMSVGVALTRLILWFKERENV